MRLAIWMAVWVTMCFIWSQASTDNISFSWVMLYGVFANALCEKTISYFDNKLG